MPGEDALELLGRQRARFFFFAAEVEADRGQLAPQHPLILGLVDRRQAGVELFQRGDVGGRDQSR
ncbi:hypothetical protein CQW44_10855 [Streptomyces griseofuscus]|uniref:Uncharacterized protein n=2 Tax=Streptomyces griseofuscus TaxID=146922 RepID=A0A426SAQ0_9ACTN|nr:hypothetical protein CQW44_10855 [Streptomyces griseofuscus]